MAYTGIAELRDDWERQAERLALTHPVVGAAAAAKRLRQRGASKAAPRSGRGGAGPEGWRGKNALDRALEAAPAPIEALIAESEAADLQAEELERELGAVRQELALRENENHSLHISLDLTTSENARLSCRLTEAEQQIATQARELGSARDGVALRLTETHSLQSSLDAIVHENARLFRRFVQSDTAAEQARAQLEQMKLALAATEAERANLTAAVDQANETSQRETSALGARIETMATDAVATEKSLSELQQTLLAQTAEKSAAERKLADAVTARKAADMQIEVLHNSLRAKEQQVLELDRSRMELIEGTDKLLKTVEARDLALAHATARIRLLYERVVRLEGVKKPSIGPEKSEERSEPACDRDAVIAPGPKYPAADRLCSADTLLASTIAF